MAKIEENPCSTCIQPIKSRPLSKPETHFLKTWFITNFDFILQVTHSFCKEFLQGLLTHLDQDGDLNVTELMRRLFEKGSKARMLSQAYHRYALNYINALNYLESLRRHNDFCDFEKVPTNAFLTAT